MGVDKLRTEERSGRLGVGLWGRGSARKTLDASATDERDGLGRVWRGEDDTVLFLAHDETLCDVILLVEALEVLERRVTCRDLYSCC